MRVPCWRQTNSSRDQKPIDKPHGLMPLSRASAIDLSIVDALQPTTTIRAAATSSPPAPSSVNPTTRLTPTLSRSSSRVNAPVPPGLRAGGAHILTA